MVLTSDARTLSIRVEDESYIGAARRAVRDRAAEIGLTGAALDKIDVLSTEMATNLCKYATAGREILVNDATMGDARAVTVAAVDRGPGMADVSTALIDGVSAGHTLGAGLGSIRRLSESFEISSEVGKGTILISTVCQDERSHKPAKRHAHFDLGWLSVPHPSETRCGDGISFCLSDRCVSLLLVDALGHGDGAADVSSRALSAFEKNTFEDAPALVQRIHTELSGSRCAALALVRIEQQANRLMFVGVGNITGRVYSYPSSTGCVSAQGTVGMRMGALMENAYEWAPGSILLMHSDGIKSSAAVESGKSGKSALMLAAQIYRDYNRANDDTTVAVIVDKRSR